MLIKFAVTCVATFTGNDLTMSVSENIFNVNNVFFFNTREVNEFSEKNIDHFVSLLFKNWESISTFDQNSGSQLCKLVLSTFTTNFTFKRIVSETMNVSRNFNIQFSKIIAMEY